MNFLETLVQWLIANGVGIVGIFVGGFIAYHVYFLSERLTLKDHLAHKDEVRRRIEQILDAIRKGRNSDVELINVKRYPDSYPHDNKLTRHGYTYLKGELKSLRFDGVELFCAVRELYKTQDGRWSLINSNGSTRNARNVLEVGLVPYEWIEYVDKTGDEFSYRPQMFVQFKGPQQSPYKYLSYYIESDTFYEDSDPMDMKWRRIEINSDTSKNRLPVSLLSLFQAK